MEQQRRTLFNNFMTTTFARFCRSLSTFGFVCLLIATPKMAEAAKFFRVVGPTAVKITALTPDGYITCNNAQIGTNYTVQTAQSVGAGANRC